MPVSQLPEDADRAWLATQSVLFVEDDRETRSLLARVLRRRVGRLIEAGDGVEGLERFVADRPAMVITDIQMPRMDGFALAEAIRRLDPHVIIIVTTAFEQITYLRRAIEAGVDKYVTKPVDIDKLEAALFACARRTRAEAMLATERQRELERLRAHEREVLGLLAGGMAHDFNNLLQSILGNVTLALDQVESGTDLRELLEEALRAAEQAGELGGRLLTLSEAMPTRLRLTSVEPTLRGALAAELADRGTTLRLELSADLPAVRHDTALLGHAFTQIARNAREAMADGGLLTVTGEARELAAGEVPPLAAGRYLQLTFGDNGPGIPAAILPKIFDPYFSTKPRGAVRGMGLGLALSLAVVRRHGGVVTAASTPGVGTVLTVLLPVAAPPPSDPSGSP